MTKPVKTIHKYSIPLTGTMPQALTIPRDGRIMSIAAQDPTGESVQMWVQVDPDQDDEIRTFWVFGTGHLIPTELELRHRGTALTRPGFVWHVFEQVD